jgi:hypothetical protein
MPFILIMFGVLLILVGYQGTQVQFFGLLKGDFTGSGNFVYWVVSILIIGGIGYVPKLKSLSDSFLVLVLLVLFISHKGFFAQFNQQIGTTQSATGASGSLSPLPAITTTATTTGAAGGIP